jgi:hypothetical protein
LSLDLPAAPAAQPRQPCCPEQPQRPSPQPRRQEDRAPERKGSGPSEGSSLDEQGAGLPPCWVKYRQETTLPPRCDGERPVTVGGALRGLFRAPWLKARAGAGHRHPPPTRAANSSWGCLLAQRLRRLQPPIDPTLPVAPGPCLQRSKTLSTLRKQHLSLVSLQSAQSLSA